MAAASRTAIGYRGAAALFQHDRSRECIRNEFSITSSGSGRHSPGENGLGTVVAALIIAGAAIYAINVWSTTKKETVDLSDMSNVMLFKYEDEEEMEDDEEVTAAAGGDATENYQDEENPNADTANAIPLPKSRKRKRPNLAFHYPLTANYELMELRKKKLQLECAKLELELEKMPLECAKLELEIQQLQRNLLNDQHNEDQTSIVQQ